MKSFCERSWDIFLAEVWLWSNGCEGEFASDDCESGIVWSGPAENIPGRSVSASYNHVNLRPCSALRKTYLWMTRRNIVVCFILGSEGQAGTPFTGSANSLLTKSPI